MGLRVALLMRTCLMCAPFKLGKAFLISSAAPAGCQDGRFRSRVSWPHAAAAVRTRPRACALRRPAGFNKPSACCQQPSRCQGEHGAQGQLDQEVGGAAGQPHTCYMGGCLAGAGSAHIGVGPAYPCAEDADAGCSNGHGAAQQPCVAIRRKLASHAVPTGHHTNPCGKDHSGKPYLHVTHAQAHVMASHGAEISHLP
jgi:hypothetical protein